MPNAARPLDRQAPLPNASRKNRIKTAKNPVLATQKLLMKRKLKQIDTKLNEVHTVLTMLLSKTPGKSKLTQKEFDQIDAAEDLLNMTRNELWSLIGSPK